MKILNYGIIPTPVAMNGKCTDCGCEVECAIEETMKNGASGYKYGERFVICPKCREYIWLSPKQ